METLFHVSHVLEAFLAGVGVGFLAFYFFEMPKVKRAIKSCEDSQDYALKAQREALEVGNVYTQKLAELNSRKLLDQYSSAQTFPEAGSA